MTASDWDDPQSRSLACLIEVAEQSHAATERWLLLWHAEREPRVFALPPGHWLMVLDSSASLVLPRSDWRGARDCVDHVTVSAPSVVGLVQHLNETM
jgi:glycogen operon protein